MKGAELEGLMRIVEARTGLVGEFQEDYEDDEYEEEEEDAGEDGGEEDGGGEHEKS